MPQAGFCDECQASVLLTPEGGCPQGHAASSVTSRWEIPGPEQSGVQAGAKGRSVWPVVAVASVVVVIGLVVAMMLSTAVVLYVEGGLQSRTQAADDVPAAWQKRVATDYPGWQAVGFLSFPMTDSDDPPETDYILRVVPPGETFSIGVMYESHKSNPPQSDDQVLRPAGSRHTLAPTLLAFLKSHYVDQAKIVDFVTPDYDGDASVNWRPKGTPAATEGEVDEITYDEATHAWEVVP